MLTFQLRYARWRVLDRLEITGNNLMEPRSTCSLLDGQRRTAPVIRLTWAKPWRPMQAVELCTPC